MLLIDSKTKDLTPWIQAFKSELGSDKVITYDEVVRAEDIKGAVVWNHRASLFREFPDIQWIASLGAGVDHILGDPYLPKKARVTKIVSPILSGPMSNFCIGAVMYFHRKFDQYAIDKRNKVWNQELDPEVDLKIGIMGLGELGKDLAGKLVYLGFDVFGWSRTKKEIPGVTSFDENELYDFLSHVNTLICMLPATPETRRILSKDLLDKLPYGSFLINVGRGSHQVNQDIIDALDSGKLEGAFLDVFPEEPLPKENSLWVHNKVVITPHIAVVTKIEAAVPQIVENYKRICAGLPLMNIISREKGY